MSLRNFLTSKVFFKNLAAAIGIIIVCVIAMLYWLDYTTNHGEEITVPNLSKMTVEKATEVLEDAELEPMILDTVDFVPGYPPYTVVQQDPLPNDKVKDGRKIYIKINAGGFSTVTLPNLIQRTLREAEPTLSAAELVVGKKTYKPYLAKDIVLEMWQDGKKLKAGDKVMKSSKIDLVLGDGKTGFDDSELESEGGEVIEEETATPAPAPEDLND